MGRSAPAVSSLVPPHTVVLPGDRVLSLATLASASGEGQPTVRLGASLRQDGDDVLAIRMGTLQQTVGGKLWVATRQRRYVPAVEDSVLGVVTDKHAEAFAVDVGGPFKASLPALSFENATRRNRPNLVVGSLVYARVLAAPKDAEATLACTDMAGKAAGYGPLTGGLPFDMDTGAARQLLSRPPPPALAALGAALAFELVVGVNGRCWVNAAEVGTCVLVAQALQETAGLGAVECCSRVQELLQRRGLV